MESHSLRYHITTGKLTLVCTYIIAAILWSFTCNSSWESWASIIYLGITTYTLRMVYNHVSLIRVRSWFLSSFFLICCSILPIYHQFEWSMLSVFFFILSQHFLFASYQEMNPERYIFHAFLFLGISSLFLPQMIWMGVLFLLAMIVQLRSLTVRSLVSVFLAVLVTLEILAAYYWLKDTPMLLLQHYDVITEIRFANVYKWEPIELANVGFLILLMVFGIFHYGRTNFGDKIKVRMLYYIIILQLILFFVLLLAYSADYKSFLLLFILGNAPIVAHFLVLGKGRILDFVFLLILFILIILALFNYGVFD